ncbi:MAG: diaminopimelate decarboxylase [Pseudomonadota bacterium]
MNHFHRHDDGTLHVETTPLAEIAEQFGTPCYVYSRAALEQVYGEYRDALAGCDSLVCYAVKANSNLAVLDVLARAGSGFDIVSVGELERVIAAGGDPSRVVFSGVGKQPHEMTRALQAGIHCFNVESQPELDSLNRVAGELGIMAPVSVRVNPDVDAQTHPYISTGLRENKFGVDMDTATAVYQRIGELPHVEAVGVDCHIGSQLTQLSPFIDALRRLLALVDDLASQGIHIRHLDLGGGLGVTYGDEAPPSVSDYISAIRTEIGERDLQLVFEPGRSIAANAGALLTRVEYLKPTPEHSFAIVDAGMNDLIRPALYEAWMDIQVVAPAARGQRARWDVVGPVCESADFLGKQRDLALTTGSLLAVLGAGAYGFGMSCNYNSRGRAAEVLVDGARVHLARERETLEDQLRGEHRLPA